MAPISHHLLSALTNPTITPAQLLTFRSHHLDTTTSNTFIFNTSLLTQTAGILLGLPQEVIATSIVVLQRYLIVSASCPAQLQAEPEHASAAAIYTCAKQSFYPLGPRSVINVYAYLASSSSPLRPTSVGVVKDGVKGSPREYYVSPSTYTAHLARLHATEKSLLTALSFDTHVVLPHALALTYLSLLSPAKSPTLAQRVFAHLNAALVSPSLVYLTHQPNILACAAIYLAAREVGVALAGGVEEWWEVYDGGREELGFLVLVMAGSGRLGRDELGEGSGA